MRKKLLLILLLLGIFILPGCKPTPQSNPVLDAEEHTGKIKAFVSILPQAYFVECIGGDKVDVSVMIPPGANPENYEISPAQLKELSTADVYIMSGKLPSEETWLPRLIAANKKMLVLDSSQSIDFDEHNPHIWLSPRLVKKQAANIAETLIQLDPDNKAFYSHNLEQLLLALDELDKEIRENLSGVKQKSFIVYHPAWGYFARDYGLEEIAIEEHGKEPGARELARLVEEARAKKINEVFASPQHSSRSAEVFAQEIGGKVVFLDPLPRNYISDMQVVAKTLADALSD